MRKFYNGMEPRPDSLGPEALLLEAMTEAERDALDPKDFGIPATRKFPIHDAAHVRAAIARFMLAPEADKPELARRIMQNAEKFGVSVSQNGTIGRYSKK
jgi:hypothetical protein